MHSPVPVNDDGEDHHEEEDSEQSQTAKKEPFLVEYQLDIASTYEVKLCII